MIPRRSSSRIDRPAGNQGSRHSVKNQADGEKLVSGSNSSKNGLPVNQNRDSPNPELPDQPSININTRKRHKWTREEYKQVLTAYYTALNKPECNITKQTYDIWRNLTGFNHHENMDPNKLASTRRYIENKNKLSNAEIEEIRLNINGAHNNLASPTQTTTDTALQETQYIAPTKNNDNHHAETVNLDEINEAKDNIIRELSITKHIDMDCREQLPKIQINKTNLEKIYIHNSALAQILTDSNKDITDLNNLIYATAVATTKSIGMNTKKRGRTNTRSQPKWKIKIMNEIESLRGELSILTEIGKGLNVRSRKGRKLRRKYDLNGGKDILVIREIIKQKIMVKSQRMRRYDKRIKFFRQNQIFKSDAKKLYREIGTKKIDIRKPPSTEDMEDFWRDIWREGKGLNENATWIEREKGRMSHIDQQEWDDICIEELKATLRKSHKWKSPGRDKIPNFWLNSLTSIHQHLADSLSETMRCPDKMPAWLSEGITYLIPKNNETENPKNYRPITCLTTIYKLLTAIITERMYIFLEENDILPIEQKGCKKNCYGCKDQLLINKMILETCSKKHRNLSTAWIDYRKAFDSVPHQWILKALDLYRISPAIKTFLQQTMTQWSTKLFLTHSNGVCVSEKIPIARGIFQGDSLSPLLFCLSLIPVTHELNSTGLGYKIFDKVVSHLLYMDDLKLYGKNDEQLQSLLETVKRFSNDIGMEFGLEKCAKVTFKRGKVTSTSHIELDVDTQIRELEQDAVYKYLGIDERAGILHNSMKEKIRREYYRRVRLVLKTELNSQNKIQAINALAVPVVLYSYNIVDWNLPDIHRMDTKTRKLLTANRMHHPKADIDRIYLPRKEGGRGLIQLALSYKTATIGLSAYTETTNDWMIKMVGRHDSSRNLHSFTKESARYRRELGIENSQPTDEPPTVIAKILKGEAKRAGMKDLHKRWQEKPLHGQYLLRTAEADVDKKKTHQWLRSSGLKAETEGFIMAAQDQSLKTRNYQANIQKNGANPKCRLCDVSLETIDHIVAGCPVLAPTEYKARHDRIGQYLHWTICKHYNAPYARNWYEHHPEPVTEAENVTILWDFPIHTDRTIKANRPDIVIKDMKDKKCLLIDMTVPADRNIAPKEFEKISKYKDLEMEIQKMWHLKTTVIPVVVGALGLLKRGTDEYVDSIPGKPKLFEVQKIALTSTAHIMRKVLSM